MFYNDNEQWTQMSRSGGYAGYIHVHTAYILRNAMSPLLCSCNERLEEHLQKKGWTYFIGIKKRLTMHSINITLTWDDNDMWTWVEK